MKPFLLKPCLPTWQSYIGKGFNRWENEEIAGRKLLKNRRKTQEKVEKMHEMEAGQSFEKARHIEASILKKLRIRSSTESSVRWGSEQDSLQGDEE